MASLSRSLHQILVTPIRKVAKQFQVATRTVQQLLNQYRATGELSPKVPSNKMQSPLEAHQDTILKIVVEHSDWFLWQYCEEVADKTGVSVTTGSMCRFLQRHKITLKKKTYRGERVKSDEVQQQRCEFWQKLKDVKAENIVSIDETGIWQGMERSVARSEEGKKAFSHRSCYKGEKHTIIGAMSVDGIVCMKRIQGSMKGADFLAFITDDLAPNLHSENVVLMDNLPAHKVEGVEKAITATGARPIYLPTYSHDFNPIEMLWSLLKYFMRLLRPKSLELIKHLLNILPLLLEKSFYKNWFTKCCYCTT